jgi:hypothetical protein
LDLCFLKKQVNHNTFLISYIFFFKKKQSQQKDTERSAFATSARSPLTHAKSHRQGATRMEDPTLYIELEESEGLHHSARQETGGRWSRPARRAHQREL